MRRDHILGVLRRHRNGVLPDATDQRGEVAGRAMITTMDNSHKLTPEQVENWRKILVGLIGPYALFLTEDQINDFHDKFQDNIDKQSKQVKP